MLSNIGRRYVVNVGLNIDWDFFFEQDETRFWNHGDNPFSHGSMLWSLRFADAYAMGEDLEKTYTADARWETLWSDLGQFGFNLDNAEVIYGDSNLGAWFVFGQYDVSHIYSFDNHSDVCYLSESGERVDCGNWLGQTLRVQEGVDATVVKPDRERLELEFGFTEPIAQSWVKTGRLQAFTYDDLFDFKLKKDVAVIFICRSGSWTPPWDDAKFMTLVEQRDNPVYLKDVFGDETPDTANPETLRDWNRNGVMRNAENGFLYRRAGREWLRIS